MSILKQTYEIIDGRGGRCVGRATGMVRASRKAERLNQQYGAVRYFYRVKGVSLPAIDNSKRT